ncbi:MAG: exo-alpha-sialidase [Bryobacterales bacterium]|nr:exo-alpha-sialidase [Bryobacterales bacterium]
MTFLLAFLFAIKLLPPETDMVFRQPQVATTWDMLGVVAGAGNDIYYAYSTNDGQTFSRPSRLETKGQLSLGRHRGPRIAYQAGNLVVSAVVGKKGKGQDGDLLVWRSQDNGKTWLSPVRVNDVAGSAREGLHAMTSGNGMVFVVWLDLRQKGTRIYGAKSTDGGASWEKNLLIYESPDGSVCECCHPSVVIGPGGAIWVMFRNSVAGNRDMYLVSSRDGAVTWELPIKLGKESWKLNGCPMDGGAVTTTGKDNVYTVWRRDKGIFVATTRGKESELGQGKDPVIAAGMNDDLTAVWTAADGSLEVRTTKNDTVRTLVPKGAYPQLIFTGRAMLAFYEEGDGVGVTVVE